MPNKGMDELTCVEQICVEPIPKWTDPVALTGVEQTCDESNSCPYYLAFRWQSRHNVIDSDTSIRMASQTTDGHRLFQTISQLHSVMTKNNFSITPQGVNIPNYLEHPMFCSAILYSTSLHPHSSFYFPVPAAWLSTKHPSAVNTTSISFYCLAVWNTTKVSKTSL